MEITYVSTLLIVEENDRLEFVLKKNKDEFAWKH